MTDAEVLTEHKAVVKFYRLDEGYGFLYLEGSGAEIYFNRQALAEDRMPRSGEAVTCNLIKKDELLYADNIKTIHGLGRKPGPAVTGVVKFFLPEKGYGFIQTENNGDVFLHAKALARSFMVDYQPAEGDKLTCTTLQNESGKYEVDLVKDVKKP